MTLHPGEVSREAFSERLNGHSGISPEMAIYLSKWFEGSAETRLRQQIAYDLAKAEKHADKIKVTKFETA